MADYINKNEVLNLIMHNDKVCHYADRRYENVVYATACRISDVVANMPAADVQPVDRWISVDKALPNNGQTVLIYFDNQFHIAKYNSNFADTMPWSSLGHWWGKELIHFWLPLLEPPKDGDTE